MMSIGLQGLAELINCNTQQIAIVKRVYKDYGQGTMYNMVVVHSESGGYQALNFREQEDADRDSLSIEDAQKIINKINVRGW